MNAFDTDVFSEILLGNAAYTSRLSLIPADQQSIPIIVAEEILRGRLNVIRQAGKANQISVDLLIIYLKKPFATCDGSKC
jgi:predicted nucleic acid-binding protein